ncbi:MAG TPA: hypothetical protein HA348_06385 [Thermoplasmata archaeon]|nr:hypothetical protein [Thermoplasmata archaeon]
MRKDVVVIMGIVIVCAGIISVLYFLPKVTEYQEELAPTKSLLTVPIGGIQRNYMYLKPGETKETNYTLYTREGGPGEVSYKIYRVAGKYKQDSPPPLPREEIPMPEGLNVSVEPSKFIAQPHKKYTSKITVKTSPELSSDLYVLYMQVIFKGENETIGDDWMRVRVKAGPYPIGGESGFGVPREDHNDSITLNPGEIKETNYTLYTREGGPGEVKYKVYRVTDVYKKREIPMPEGMNVSIEPNHFLARTHEKYISKITVKTSSKLSPGEYVLCIHQDFKNGTIGDSWLAVNVEP